MLSKCSSSSREEEGVLEDHPRCEYLLRISKRQVNHKWFRTKTIRLATMANKACLLSYIIISERFKHPPLTA